MTRCTSLAVAVLLASVGMFADSIQITDGGPVAFNNSLFDPAQASPTGGPFWNNNSYDGTNMNVGYVLTNSGGVAGTNVLGSDSVANAYVGDGGADPSAFSLLENGASYNIRVLFADSSENRGPLGTTFGWYDVNDTSDLHPIFSDVTNTNAPLADQVFAPGVSQYGFYTSVCYAVSNGACTSTETYFSASPNTGDFGALGWNHFALFNLNSFAENYVIAFTGQNGLYAEGVGDFNDLVIELSDPKGGQITATPEPASLAIVGFGLIGLGFAKRRFLKK